MPRRICLDYSYFASEFQKQKFVFIRHGTYIVHVNVKFRHEKLLDENGLAEMKEKIKTLSLADHVSVLKPTVKIF